MKKRHLSLTFSVLTVVFTACVFAACGSSKVNYSDADVTFSQGMIPHHQQAVTMAGLASERASDQRVKTLAESIKAAQEPEIVASRDFLKSFHQPEMDAMHASHDIMGMGMANDSEMNQLMAASGADFDRLFVQLMTAHHNGAIAMAEEEIAAGRYQPTLDLAAAIKSAQQAEVDQMKSWNL